MKAGAISLGCAPNFRDLGGLRTRNGSRLRRGLLFRSEAIVDPDGPDIASLAAAGIRLVCDLRGASERARSPGHDWRAGGVEVVEIDVAADLHLSPAVWDRMRVEAGAAAARDLMLETYRCLPRGCAPGLATLFERLVDGHHPLLVHCTAGKDRTGFLVAMVLHALGVGDDIILADYLASGERGSDLVVEATRAVMNEATGTTVDDATLNVLAGVEADYLEASLAVILARYGSVDLYLEQAAGLDAARRNALVSALTEEAGLD